MDERFRVGGSELMTLSWAGPKLTEYRDYAPILEVWNNGAQIHMNCKVEPGLKVQVLMGGVNTFLAGQVESCVFEGLYGYLVEITLRPKSVGLVFFVGCIIRNRAVTLRRRSNTRR
jgi:hypothetical protein